VPAMLRWFRSLLALSAEGARARILAGTAPAGITLQERLSFAREAGLSSLPERLTVRALDLSECRNLAALPVGLRCGELILRRTNIERLPPDLIVQIRIDAQECRQLKTVPPLRVERLILRSCTALEELPVGLVVRHLDLRQCVNFARFPETISKLDTLDVSGCSNLNELPEGLSVKSWIDIAGSGLKTLPWSLRSTRIHWRGLRVSDRIAFDPESITVDEILAERNQELRRVLLERVGLEWFVDQAHAIVVDQDTDPGGQRMLLRIPIDNSEDMFYVQVQCPSTAKRYLLRVPPNMQTCRQAIAWTAGYNNPDDYRPVQET
jgi:hypothetical protein